MLKNYKQILKDHDFRHRYLYDEKDNRVGVIVIVKEGKGNFKKYYTGYSICSKQENNFNKKLGKAIAILRAKSGKADLDKIPKRFKTQVERKLPTMFVKY